MLNSIQIRNRDYYTNIYPFCSFWLTSLNLKYGLHSGVFISYNYIVIVLLAY